MTLRPLIAFALLCFALDGCAQSKKPDVVFSTNKGEKVYADFVKSPTAAKGLAVMFHQAGSSAAEYRPIAPEIAAQGYDCLLVDLRSGGKKFGGVNRTAQQYSKRQDFESAYADVLASMDYAKKRGYKSVIAFGSSYSAALVIRLNAEYPGKELKGTLSFSPGEYLGPEGYVKGLVAKAKRPMFLTSTPEEARQWVQGFSDALPPAIKKRSEMYVPAQAVHGAAMLRRETNKGAAPILVEVKLWLHKL